MKASVMHSFGGPEVLHLETVPDPVPADDEVLIQVHAVTINRTLDLLVRAGRYSRPVRLPHVLGADPAGEIVAVGAKVTTRRPGQRVVTVPILRPANGSVPPVLLGVSVWGGYAELVTVPASATQLIPDGLGWNTAAVIARHAPMALHLLEVKGQLRPVHLVLIMGAAGGLGMAGVQIAKWLGATVLAGAGSPERVAAALALGADHGIDYRATVLDEEVSRITGGRGVDVVFENIGEPTLFGRAFNSLARGGRLVTAGSHGGGVVPLNVTQLYQRQLTIAGSTGLTASDIDRTLQLASEGRLRAEVAQVMSLADAAQAHVALESGQVTGKIVLTP